MCLFVGNTQIQEGSEEGTTPVPTDRQYRHSDTGEDFEIFWSGALDKLGLFPRLQLRGRSALVCAPSFFPRLPASVCQTAATLNLLLSSGDRTIVAAFTAHPSHEDGPAMHGGARHDGALRVAEATGGGEPEADRCVGQR